jgi:hypothetical protein
MFLTAEKPRPCARPWYTMPVLERERLNYERFNGIPQTRAAALA